MDWSMWLSQCSLALHRNAAPVGIHTLGVGEIVLPCSIQALPAGSQVRGQLAMSASERVELMLGDGFALIK